MHRAFTLSGGFEPNVLISNQKVRWFSSLLEARLTGLAPTKSERFWLTLEGSLTRALRHRSRERFRVRVIREAFVVPRPDERQRLAIPPRELVWMREVELCGDGQPWVLARTLFPLHTLRDQNRRLRHLGRQPLGSILFRDRHWYREPFEIGHCPATTEKGPTVARRSRFRRGSDCILVSEFFYPALLDTDR